MSKMISPVFNLDQELFMSHSKKSVRAVLARPETHSCTWVEVKEGAKMPTALEEFE